MPSLDREQSYTLLSMVESDGQTIMTFRRAIQSCDEEDYHITVRHAPVVVAFKNVPSVPFTL